MALTRRQKQVLDLIAKFVDDNGYSPSYEELAQGLNLASLATVHKHISALTAKNYLKRGFNQSRSLELGPKYVQENRRHREAAALEIPLLGRIAAGVPVESVEQRATEVRDGEIVVALVEGSETTLKRFYREPGGKVRLQPANAALQPIVVPAADVQIQGRLLAVLRKYK